VTEYGDLVAKKLTVKLSEDKLKERISNFFKEQTMCVISTASTDGQPRSTPLECFAEGMTLYIFADPGTKVENIKVNPKVSIAMCNQLKPNWSGDNWKVHKAVKITGVARLLGPDDPENIRAMKEVIPWLEYVGALGWDISEPPKGLVIKVESKKIEYTENGLMAEGYSSKQVWKA
jgi:nitroimidazol reductase NimA-like FMN-containing flavoprotein (pyridoxamine 5'-phosphate oxidase superfamily)